MGYNMWSDESFASGLALLSLEDQEKALKFLDTQGFGSKKLRHSICSLGGHTRLVNEALAYIEFALKPKEAKVRKNIESETKKKLVRYLTACSERILKGYCDKHNVSYTSYMTTGDKEGLIEALVTEIMVTVEE